MSPEQRFRRLTAIRARVNAGATSKWPAVGYVQDNLYLAVEDREWLLAEVDRLEGVAESWATEAERRGRAIARRWGHG